MKRSFTQTGLVVLLAVWMMGVTSCANILPPSGGDRDSLPPVLVSATPKDSAVNVSPQQFTLTFDEFVRLDNAYSNLIVSPALKYPIKQLDAKLRNITVKLKDTLEPNTTYSFDFGNAIQDVNESNVARRLIYVFSTGNKIDNNTYSGKVVLAETGKVDSTMLVILHRNLDDSAVAKEAPRYYTRMNGRGEFTFYHLPEGRFAVYALATTSPMRTYTDSTSLFAFRSEPVVISASTPRDTLYAYAYKKTALAATTPASPLKLPPNADKRLRYSADLDNGQQDILRGMSLNFLRRLSAFDSSKIGLYDTSFRKLTGYTVSLDSNKTKVAITYPWKENTAYRLLVEKDAVADSLGTALTKTDTLRFYTKRESEYGSIRIRFNNLDLSRNPVVQLVQDNNLIESIPLTRPEIYRKLFKPGSYNVRILYDANKNGVWDPGSFFNNKRQPEMVIEMPRQISIRANWDNDVTLML